MREAPDPEPPPVDEPPPDRRARPQVRRAPVGSFGSARRALTLLGPILVGVAVAWLVIMITR